MAVLATFEIVGDYIMATFVVKERKTLKNLEFISRQIGSIFCDHEEDRFMTPNFMMKTNFTPLEKRRKQLCCWYVFSNSTFLVFRLIKQGEKEGENLDPT